ncbi:TPM domain-containing protein [Sphingomonas sp. KR3-1]|uniref:TPM domain-containing protein n=1 Tax=Sphingomonas sp. KR3-1 TaxID=3156611 RepID=UPI0032B5CEC7
MFRLALAAALALGLPAAAPAKGGPQFPALTGDVVDDAHVLSDATRATLTRELADLRHKTGHRLVVATIASLEGLEPNDYGIALFRTWQVGRKGEDDGAILFIAPRERPGHRAERIEVGYKLEPILTDAASSDIIRQIRPQLVAGNYDAAMLAGERAIVARISAPVDGKPIQPPPVPAPPAPEMDWVAWAILIGFLGFMAGIFWIVFIAVRAAIRAARGARRLAAGNFPHANPLAGFQQSMQADFDRSWAENTATIERHRAESIARMEAAKAEAARRPARPGAPQPQGSDTSPEPLISPEPPAPPIDTGWTAPDTSWTPTPPTDPTQWGWDPSPPPPVPDTSWPDPPAPPPPPADDSGNYTGGSAGGGGADDRW